jgi:hypothetical protein
MSDQDAEAFVRVLSRRLAAGDSLAAALTASREARFAEGAPAAAWAGVVLLGDGDFVPIPGGRGMVRGRYWPAALAAVMLAAVLVWFVRRRSAGVR